MFGRVEANTQITLRSPHGQLSLVVPNNDEFGGSSVELVGKLGSQVLE